LGGDITPAIITTSCICVGLVALELYKILDFIPPTNTPNVISLLENSQNAPITTTDDYHNSKMIDVLRNHSYNANSNHFHQFPIGVLEIGQLHRTKISADQSNNDVDGPICVMDNIIIVKTDNQLLTFSYLVEKILETLGILILRIFSFQFHQSGSGYDILYAKYPYSQRGEESILSLLSSLGKFSTSSFFFNAEFEDYDGENAIDLFVQFI